MKGNFVFCGRGPVNRTGTPTDKPAKPQLKRKTSDRKRDARALAATAALAKVLG